ncbi:MAG: hypothetical protein M3Z23_15120 [Acidobacteriota bacterium]|nr:hypothetical protein [Acidobacteriota bacterium]
MALITVALLGSVLPTRAQQDKEPGSAVYRVEFNVRDGSEGTAKSSRHYTMLIDQSRKGFLQAGNRIITGSPQSTYVDVGVSIECMVSESNSKIALQGSIEVSSIVPREGIPEPVVRQRKMSFNTAVEPGVPTVIIDERKAVTAAIPSKPIAIGQVEAMVTKME